jgi:hypothetical protein
MSHKVARLLLPFAILIALGSSFALPGNWARVAVAGEALFFAIAAFDPWLPRFLRRISSPMRTFATLMVATLFAGSILVVPASRFWSASTGGTK